MDRYEHTDKQQAAKQLVGGQKRWATKRLGSHKLNMDRTMIFIAGFGQAWAGQASVPRRCGGRRWQAAWLTRGCGRGRHS